MTEQYGREDAAIEMFVDFPMNEQLNDTITLSDDEQVNAEPYLCRTFFLTSQIGGSRASRVAGEDSSGRGDPSRSGRRQCDGGRSHRSKHRHQDGSLRGFRDNRHLSQVNLNFQKLRIINFSRIPIIQLTFKFF